MHDYRSGGVAVTEVIMVILLFQQIVSTIPLTDKMGKKGVQLRTKKDGDGEGDDRNGNNTPDYEELDFDHDGVPRAKIVPWDAFPLYPKEWRDTDGDGFGDNADSDGDGDGWNDEEVEKAGTDPFKKLSFPNE